MLQQTEAEKGLRALTARQADRVLGGTQAGKAAGRLLGGMKKHDAEAKRETRPSVADMVAVFSCKRPRLDLVLRDSTDKT